jgi:hypothetical protein
MEAGYLVADHGIPAQLTYVLRLSERNGAAGAAAAEWSEA